MLRNFQNVTPGTTDEQEGLTRSQQTKVEWVKDGVGHETKKLYWCCKEHFYNLEQYYEINSYYGTFSFRYYYFAHSCSVQPYDLVNMVLCNDVIIQ